MKAHRLRAIQVLTVGLLLAGTTSLDAVDGVVLIDQNRVLAGNVTPGDAPGFPVSITIPGSYRLSSNLVVADRNTTAIDVTGPAGSVAIDLNGFSIIGPSTCDASVPPQCAPAADDPSAIFGGGVGIRSGATGTLSVKGGTIRGMGRTGMFVFNAPLVIVDSVEVRDNALGGISIGIGNVTNSVVSRNGGHGVSLNQGVVKGNLITRNGGNGVVSTGLWINVIENTISQNAQSGIDFASTGAYSHNVLSSNLAGPVSGSGVQTAGNVCNGAAC